MYIDVRMYLNIVLIYFKAIVAYKWTWNVLKILA